MPASTFSLFEPCGRSARHPFSLLSSTFSTKPRNLSGFAIGLDDPHRRYGPGEVVRGHVELTVHKTTKITHIVISLLGYVKVYKHPVLLGDGVPADVVAPSTGRGKRGTEFHGNGQALLFEEEKVICGDGRLTPGRYTFEFGINFPFSSLPSSLDFERGTIAYSVVSTLTRPATINPTLTCDKKVLFDEEIDVALRKPPKPDLITSTPLNNRTKQKRRAKARTDGTGDQTGQGLVDSPIDCARSQAGESQDGNSEHPPRRGSAATSVDSSNPSLDRPQMIHSSSLYDESVSSKAVLKKKTITARVELLHGGYLPGDLIPVRVFIQHTKYVKAIQGVIVTLYRIGRIDRHPLLPITNSLRYTAAEQKHDPNSKIGLASLSLSTAEKSHSFRMELAQSIAPMVVNPNTLQADVKTAVRIPDCTIPTITSVPGQMISFTYHVEVIIDLHGKLSALDGLLPRINISDPASVFGLPSTLGSTDYGSSGSSQKFINTAQLRREKSIADSTFDIVIGTKDSAPRVTRKPEDPWEKAAKASAHGSEGAAANGSQPRTPQATTPQRHTPQPQVPSPVPEPIPNARTNLQHLAPPPQQSPHPWPDSVDHHQPSHPAHNLIPPPRLQEPTDEKERMRAAEARLLPSAPPVVYGADSQLPPSAPRLEDLEGPAPPEFPDRALRSDPAFHGSRNEDSTIATPPPAAGLSDDKQELERRRLLALASSPYDDEEADDGGEGAAGPSASHVSPGSTAVHAPSAPFFDEHGEYVPPAEDGVLDDIGYTPEVDHLPRYQR